MIPKGKLLIIGGGEDKGGENTPEMESKEWKRCRMYGTIEK